MDILSIVLGAGTILGGSGTAFLYWETRGQRGRAKRKEEIKAHVAAEVTSVRHDLLEVRTRMDAEGAHLTTIIKASLSDALEPIRAQITVLSTKIDPMWKALEAQSVAAAQALHHPVPERAALDALLDDFLDSVQHGTEFSEEKRRALRTCLVKIVRWEEGQDIGFPVYPGEPTSAAVLLSTMELSRIRQYQEHQSHERGLPYATGHTGCNVRAARTAG